MRAPRFPLHLVLRYRRIGEDTWRQAQTENISRSGVLFRTEDPFEVNTPVELSMVLATGVVRRDAAEVLCRGRVVRTVAPTENAEAPGSAVAIEDYAFHPPPAALLSFEL
jgi:hypothetical protein